MNFIEFKELLQKQFKKMCESGELYTTETTKSEIWDCYLESFPPGSDPLYKTNTQHDCNCCKSFIRKAGNVVAIINNQVVTLWDVGIKLSVDDPYLQVAMLMSQYVKNKKIKGLFRHYKAFVGTDNNHKMLEESNEVITFDHFHLQLPNRYVMDKDSIATFNSKERAKYEVSFRGLNEISIEAVETVIELIDQGSLYRGDEHLTKVMDFKKSMAVVNDIPINDVPQYVWVNRHNPIRNSVIGTLLTDISEGVELTTAVNSFEKKVAPENYKRPTALVTKAMIDKAKQKFIDLGYEGAIQRRFANIDDITINNVIFANRDAKKSMDAFDELKESVPEKTSSFDKLEEVSIEKFIKDILPNVNKIEMLVENKMVNNLVSLVAPVNTAQNMLQWDNNFTWSYNGEVTDSIKERVKKAGGDVTGDLRFSLSWFNTDDLDLHCHTPGNNISYQRKHDKITNGRLDVDMNVSSLVRDPVENITWPAITDLKPGEYSVRVHNFSKRESVDVGFELEMEYLGDVKLFKYASAVSSKKFINAIDFNVDDNGCVSFNNLIPEGNASKDIWGINTESFVNVSMIMNSPNHWDGQSAGNKHWFFMLEGCVNDSPTRGFYNEFLSSELTEHRKVIEMLSSKMRVPQCKDQLSGLGFSSTARKQVVCKVSGSFERTLKINF